MGPFSRDYSTTFITLNPCDEHVYTYCDNYLLVYIVLTLVCNDDYLIVTTDTSTSVMTSSTPGATPNTPPGNHEVQIISWPITVTKCCGRAHHTILCSYYIDLVVG